MIVLGISVLKVVVLVSEVKAEVLLDRISKLADPLDKFGRGGGLESPYDLVAGEIKGLFLGDLHTCRGSVIAAGIVPRAGNEGRDKYREHDK